MQSFFLNSFKNLFFIICAVAITSVASKAEAQIAKCSPGEYVNTRPDQQPKNWGEIAYYGFGIYRICNESGATSDRDKDMIKANPEGFYKLTMFLYLALESKNTVYNITFTTYSVNASDQNIRVAAEKVLDYGVSIGTIGIPNGLTKTAQKRFGEEVLTDLAKQFVRKIEKNENTDAEFDKLRSALLKIISEDKMKD